jgi:hypothetical protein
MATAFILGLPKDAIEAAADKTVIFTFKNGTTRGFAGRSLLLSFSVPQFFFHVTTAYDIPGACRRRSREKRFPGTAAGAVSRCD